MRNHEITVRGGLLTWRSVEVIGRAGGLDYCPNWTGMPLGVASLQEAALVPLL